MLWIAKKQTVNTLFYSLTRLAARTAVVIVAAYYSRQVNTVIRSLVIIEAIRLIVMTAYAIKQKLMTAKNLADKSKQLTQCIAIDLDSLICDFPPVIALGNPAANLRSIGVSPFSLGNRL